MAKQMMTCLKCGVELSCREMILKYCFICFYPDDKPKREDPLPEWNEWNEAIYRND